MKEKLKQLINEIEELNQVIRNKDSKIHEFEFKLQTSSEEIQRTLQLENSRLKGVNQDYENKIALLTTELERWRLKSLEISKELDSYRIRIEEFENHERLRISKNSFESQTFEQRIDFLTKENNDCKEKLKKLIMEIEELNQVIRSKDSKIHDFEYKTQISSDELQRSSQIEISKLRGVIHEHEEKIASLTFERERLKSDNRNDILVKENSDLKENLRKLILEIDELHQLIRTKDSKIHEFEFKIQTTSDDSNLRAENLRLKSRISEYEEKNVLLSQELERWRVKSLEINKDLSEVHSKGEERFVVLTSELEKSKRDSIGLKEKLKSLITEIGELTNLLRTKEVKIQELQVSATQNTRDVTLQFEINQLKNSNTEKDETIRVMKQEIERWRNKWIESIKQLEALKSNINTSEQMMRINDSQKSSELQVLEQEISRLKSENNRLQGEKSELIDQLNKLPDKVDKVKRKDHITVPVEDVQSLRSIIEEYENKLAMISTENERLRSKEAAVSRLAIEIQELNDVLRQKDNRIRELEHINSNQPSILFEVENIKSKLQQAEGVKKLLESNLQEKDSQIQSLNIQLLEAKGVRDSHSQQGETIQRLISELQESQRVLKTLEGAKAQNQTLNLELERLRNEKHATLTQIEIGSSNVREYEERLRTVEQQKEQFMRELDQLRSQESRTQELHIHEIEQFKRIIQEFSGRAGDRGEIETLNSQIQQLKLTLESEYAKNRSLINQTEELNQRLMERDRRIQEISSTTTVFEGSRPALQELETYRRRAMELEQQLLQRDQKVTGLVLIETEVQRLQEALKQKDQSLARLVQEVGSCNQTIVELQTRKAESQRSSEVLNLTNEVNRLTAVLNGKESELQQLQNHFYEEVNKIRKDTSGKEGDIRVWEERYQELVIGKDRLGFEKKELEEKILRYEEKLAMLAGEIERLTTLVKDRERGFEQYSMGLVEEIGQLKAKLRELEVRTERAGEHEIRTSAAIQEIEAMKTELREKDRTIDSLKRFNNELEGLVRSNDSGDIRHRNQELESILQNTQTTYQENLGRLISEIGALNEELRRRSGVPESGALQGEVERLKKELQEKNLQLLDVSAQDPQRLVGLQREIEHLQVKNQELEGQIGNMLRFSQHEGGMGMEVQRLNEMMKVKSDENNEWKGKHEELIGRFQKKDKEYEEKLALLASEIMRLTGLLNESQQAGKLVGELERFNIALKQKAEELDFFKRDQEKVKREAEALKKDNAGLLEKMGVLAMEIQRLGKVLVEKEQLIMGLKSQGPASSGLEESFVLAEKLKLSENRLKAAIGEIERLQSQKQQRERLYDDEEELLSKVRLLEQEQSISNEEAERLKSLLRQKTQELESVKSRAIDLETEVMRFQAGNENIQGQKHIDRMELNAADNLILNSNMELATNEIDRLRVILDQKTQDMEGFRSEVERLRLETLKLPDYQNKVAVLVGELEKLNVILNDKMQHIYILEEELAKLKFSAEQPMDKLIAEYEKQIFELRQQLTIDAEEKLETSKKHIIGAQQQFTESSEEVERLKLELARLESQNQAAIETHRFTILQLTERIEEINALALEKGGQLEPLGFQLQLAQGELERLRLWQEQALKEIEGLKVEIEGQKQDGQLLGEKNADLEGKLAAILREIETLTALCRNYQDHLDMAHKDILQRDQAIRSHETETARLKEIIGSLRKDTEILNEKLLEFELARAGNLALEQKLKVNSDNIHVVLQENAGMLELTNKLRESLDQKDTENRALKKQMLELKEDANRFRLEGEKHKGALQRLLDENEKLAIGLDLSTNELRRKSIPPLGVSKHNLNQSSVSLENEGNMRNELKQAMEDIKSLRGLIKDMAAQIEVLRNEKLHVESEKEEMRRGYENIRKELLSGMGSMESVRSSGDIEREGRIEALIKSVELLTNENTILKQKIDAFSLELITKDVSSIALSGGMADKHQMLEKSLEIKVQELQEYQEKNRLLEARIEEFVTLSARLEGYEEKTLKFKAQIEHLEAERQHLLLENANFNRVLLENMRDIEDLASDRKTLMLKVEMLLEQNARLQDRVNEDENLREELELRRKEGAEFEILGRELKEKVEVSIELEIRGLKEQQAQERMLWIDERGRQEAEIMRVSERARDLEKGLLEVSSENAMLKDMYEKEKGEKIDMNSFYMGEMQKLKGRFEASIVQKVVKQLFLILEINF